MSQPFVVLSINYSNIMTEFEILYGKKPSGKELEDIADEIRIQQQTIIHNTINKVIA